MTEANLQELQNAMNMNNMTVSDSELQHAMNMNICIPIDGRKNDGRNDGNDGMIVINGLKKINMIFSNPVIVEV
jgi:hypothetical protein